MLAIAFLTYLCGGEDYPDMALFAKHRAREFGLLPYTTQIPSQDTFERLFSILTTEYVERCVVEHGKRVMDIMNEKQIAIDGKKECGTAPKIKGPKGDYLVHAWATENSVLIGQEKVRDKENEITAIPRLLDRLVIDGAVISIDAMGTQVDIADKIVGKNAHYFLAVKEDQEGLIREIQDVIRYNSPTSTHSATDKEHARVETRSISIYPADRIEDKEIQGRWKNLRTLVCVHAQTIHVSDNGRIESKTRYYMFALAP